MSASPGKDIVIRLDTIDQLFNAPDIDSFSDEEVDVLGEPALLRAVRRLQAHRIRNWEGVRLTLCWRPARSRSSLLRTWPAS